MPKSNASQKITESAAKCRQYVETLSPSVKIQKLNMLSLIREVAYPARPFRPDVFKIVELDFGRARTGNYANQLELPLTDDKTALSDCSETFATFL